MPRLIQRDYGLTTQEAKALFQQVWIYTFGIGVLCAARVCHFSEEEINDLLGQNFAAMMMLIKSGGLSRPIVHSVPAQQDTRSTGYAFCLVDGSLQAW